MILPRIGERYPIPTVGPHAGHAAEIVALDLHGEESWVEDPAVPPTITVRCECGFEFSDDLIEAVPPVRSTGRRISAA